MHLLWPLQQLWAKGCVGGVGGAPQAPPPGAPDVRTVGGMPGTIPIGPVAIQWHPGDPGGPGRLVGGPLLLRAPRLGVRGAQGAG